jgi:uncharacterized damage-inducible protein DinB
MNDSAGQGGMDGQFQRMLEHMFWADTRLLDMLDEYGAGANPGLAEAVRLFSHVLTSERIWLLRLRNEDSSAQPTWPELGLDRMRTLAERNAVGYARLLQERDDTDLAADVVYSSSQGVPYRNTMSDILMHVVLHGSYHRGQIASTVRAAGLQPVNTDFIAFARLDAQA